MRQCETRKKKKDTKWCWLVSFFFGNVQVIGLRNITTGRRKYGRHGYDSCPIINCPINIKPFAYLRYQGLGWFGITTAYRNNGVVTDVVETVHARESQFITSITVLPLPGNVSCARACRSISNAHTAFMGGWGEPSIEAYLERSVESRICLEYVNFWLWGILLYNTHSVILIRDVQNKYYTAKRELSTLL